MIKRKHLYIPIIIILVVVVYQLQAFINPTEITTKKIEIHVESTKPSHLSEIENVITEYDSILSSEIKKSGIVGAAIVITYKNEIALLKQNFVVSMLKVAILFSYMSLHYNVKRC